MGDLYLNICPGWNFTTNLSCSSVGIIILAWDPSTFDVDIVSISSQHIHSVIKPKSTGVSFQCTFIYGMNGKNERLALWNSLSHIADNCKQPWVIMGDFNALMEIKDRIGGPVRLGDIQAMRNCMVHCNLSTIKTVGRQYTWNNKQEGEARVFSRIDRVLANASWLDLFPTAEANYLPEGEFDHSPMLLCFHKNVNLKRPFRFFNMWANAENFIDVVQTNWEKPVFGCTMYRILQRLKWLKVDLKQMNKEGFSNVEAENTKLYSNLLQIQARLHATPNDGSLADAEKLAAADYKQAHNAYMSYLHQTAKINWLAQGDENTRVFHQSIKQRRRHNTIHSIQNMQGDRVTTIEGVKDIFT
ncbi:uncharacterized protein [Spinacia oleracea]|uniref:Endonuclease/exonuclease/phosphatase domain-containing protein n=1 Tax=Spinacia oleracea TaxID=3562 RepID=A0ABM3R886_SPIOL|nr:uncharacterized protein LOC110775584 [Spinacia oleracea]